MSKKLRFEGEKDVTKTAADATVKPKRKPKYKLPESEYTDMQASDLSAYSTADNFHADNSAKTSSPTADDTVTGQRHETPTDSKTHTATDKHSKSVEYSTDTNYKSGKTHRNFRDSKSGSSSKSSSRLKFSKEEKNIDKLEKKAEKYGEKLDTARGKLPTKKVRKKERIFDEGTGKSKTKIRFEKEPVPIGEAKWNKVKKKSVPRKAVSTVKTAGVNKLHSKVYEVEHENVGTQAAHRAELLGESAYRGGKKITHSAYRFVRNAPYRKVSKLEVKSLKTDMKLSYQKALRDNPKLKSNPVSRFFQKRVIKKEYATAIRNAKKSGKTAKKAVGVVQKTGQVITGLVRRNPLLLVKIGILMLIIFALMALLSMCGTLFSGGTGVVGAVSYAADDADIDNAELVYTEWETDLQLEIRNAESTHSGYDEYRYNVGDIGHDPYELMGFLTAKYQDFTYSEILSVLQGIFAEQYQLDFVEEIEIRTRTVTHTDEDGEEYEVEEEYEWYILNVNLTSVSFSTIVMPRINADQYEHFALLMRSKGARQYVSNPFTINWLPFVTSSYGYRVHPISGGKDYHKGIDIGRPTGTEIQAGFDGTVITVGYDSGGYGNYVVIENEKGVQAKYAHCDSVTVSQGQSVKKGYIIATVGNTGNSTGPHLHLEIVKDGQYLNPAYFCETGDDGSGRIPPGYPGGVNIPDYPGEPLGDGSYAALIAEAEKHLGKKYVFGASGPANFDCSGFVCWVYTKSGVYNLPRTTAQGIFNQCTPVSASSAKPGDLIFFTGTYSTPNAVSHIGIYVGNGMMLHCGNPIQYTSINTSYWKSHFYSYGRLPGV